MNQLMIMNPETLYQALVRAGITVEGHESDLYFPATHQSRSILRRFPKHNVNARNFGSGGKTWIDVAFAYDPFWERRKNPGSDYHAEMAHKLEPLQKLMVDQNDPRAAAWYEGRIFSHKLGARQKNPHGKKRSLDVFQKHQKKIALATLKMSDAGALIMGGMSKSEARRFLESIGYDPREISRMERNPSRKKRVPVFKTRTAAENHRKYFLKGKKVKIGIKGKGKAKRYYWCPAGGRKRNGLTRGVQGLANPKSQTAKAGFKMFHDANPDKAYKVKVPDSFPKRMYAIGKLHKLVLSNGTVLRGGMVAAGGGDRLYLLGVTGSAPATCRVKQIEYVPPRVSTKAGATYYHPFRHPPTLRNKGRGFYTLAGKGVKLTPRGIVG